MAWRRDAHAHDRLRPRGTSSHLNATGRTSAAHPDTKTGSQTRVIGKADRHHQESSARRVLSTSTLSDIAGGEQRVDVGVGVFQTQ